MPFSDDDYNAIFKVSKSNPHIVVSRENGVLEFKESFSSDVLSRCMKTIAGFANNEGGYIVFGIKDKPHELQGLNLKSEERFDNLDPVKLTESLNGHFSPEIRFEMQKYVFREKSFGILYVFESRTKPVVCIKTEGDNLRESAIYYRYRGQSREIRYSELKQILDDIVEKNNQMWQEAFRRISKIGVDNLALINTTTGDMSMDGRNFLIDEKLMSKLKYIDEGHFVEKDGAPALKIVGNLKPIDSDTMIISNTKIVTKAGIRAENIVKDFLQSATVENTEDYITQICFESSSYLPVFYYISQSGNTLEEVLSLLENVRSRQQSKDKLVDRLTNKPSLCMKLRPSNSKIYADKIQIRESILQGTYVQSEDILQVRYFTQVVRSFDRDELIQNKSIIATNLLYYYQEYYLDRNFKYMDDLRKAICYLDMSLYA